MPKAKLIASKSRRGIHPRTFPTFSLTINIQPFCPDKKQFFYILLNHKGVYTNIKYEIKRKKETKLGSTIFPFSPLTEQSNVHITGVEQCGRENERDKI